MPATPMLYVLVNAHFLLGGVVFGLMGALLVRVSGAAWGRRLGWIVAAKFLSTTLLLMPLSVGFARMVPPWLGLDPLGRLPWLLAVFAALATLVSALAEWPFFARAVQGASTSLLLSLRANAITMLLVVAVYLPFCQWGSPACATPNPVPEGLQVFFIREGSLFRKSFDSPETCLLSARTFSSDARLFARRGEGGWDLWLQDRDSVRLLDNVADATAEIASQAPTQVRVPKAVHTREATLAETFGKPAEMFPEADSAWSLRVGRWPWEGLEISSRDLKGAYRVALDTPLLSWDVRCATRLPGEQALFQMGPYLWWLDLETRRASVFAKGQGPLVIKIAPSPKAL